MAVLLKPVERLAAEAEAGYDVEETLRRRAGRPPLGSGPASPSAVVESWT